MLQLSRWPDKAQLEQAESGNAYFYSENIQDLIRIIECFGLGETVKVI